MNFPRWKIVLALAVMALFGAVSVLDYVTHRCLLAGGAFRIDRWSCVVRRPIQIDRNLRRS